jgi:hypothetical protein
MQLNKLRQLARSDPAGSVWQVVSPPPTAKKQLPHLVS